MDLQTSTALLVGWGRSNPHVCCSDLLHLAGFPDPSSHQAEKHGRVVRLGDLLSSRILFVIRCREMSHTGIGMGHIRDQADAPSTKHVLNVLHQLPSNALGVTSYRDDPGRDTLEALGRSIACRMICCC